MPLNDGDSPFEVPVEEVGQRVDLTEPRGRLKARLIELLHRESGLDAEGVRCPLKQDAAVTCSACRLSQAHLDLPLSALCRVGREQEVVLTEMVILEHADPEKH